MRKTGNMAAPAPRRDNARSPWGWFFAGVLLAGLAAAGFFFFGSPKKQRPGAGATNLSSTGNQPEPKYAGSQSCKDCHQEAFKLWQGSHHALAERSVSPAQDSTAFVPSRQLHFSTNTSEVAERQGKFEILTAGSHGSNEWFTPTRVLGVEPLRQFLVPFPDGRIQSTELAFAPSSNEWFDVFGAENRQPGEWGHWTGRGMTWNAMCADCHNTGVRKNYDAKADSYATQVAEVGVGCEACHGPMADHNAWQAKHPHQEGDPTLHPLSREQVFAGCGDCHARRTELTGHFKVGDSFYDHFALSMLDETGLFYADGQVKEEDFEFTAFMGSKMRAAGVRCQDCHESHSAKLRVPGDNLCLVCHGAPAPPAPKIVPATHNHHQAGTPGSHCVDCHMPVTTYMQRHERRDHGFTIPDPLLTQQFGIPNACNRCHTNQTTEWALRNTQEWYGQKMERSSRHRAQVFARALRGETNEAPALIGFTKTETNSFWRAVAAGLLKRWNDEPETAAALAKSASDPEPLVRMMSLRALQPGEGAPSANTESVFTRGLMDSARCVRIEAAWGLRATLDTNSVAGKDFEEFLLHNSDEPSGAMQQGVFALERGQPDAAIDYFHRAVGWDPNSAPLREALAVALGMVGRSAESVTELRAACRLAPKDAEARFKLGLALNEAGDTAGACDALAQTVKLDPGFTRAWYNLGLAYSATEKPEAALDCLIRAESLAPNSADIPYARATILARLGRVEEARTAARRALEIQPEFREAKELLGRLNEGPR